MFSFSLVSLKLNEIRLSKKSEDFYYLSVGTSALLLTTKNTYNRTRVILERDFFVGGHLITT